ncbi:NtaA/DmoA family FMN-dependent monooxygenase [Streptomyces sp. NBC_00568]|uniref:NtaA/DmoA family FMN-dependent monooxygenase n=1 Tax=Streptomyces sp. NBC_00568 TaxID=2975779 RepID=UPI00224D230A|nr:NtaA/DmoA family FMN-dependent monooxygenase [Streptomyces sp. NBC_00568]MCX4991964.1 NtaA/DmoA family FMN-dependent monooxygenase [Streptomyces sp. NBC_00568]
MTVRKRMHLAVRLPGLGGTTAGTGRRSGSPVDFAAFERLARTAERGLFDFLLLTGGERSGETEGRVHDPDTVGRPEAVTVLNALAAVTERLGLAATVDTVSHQPYELARRLATLDHLSEGRAAWNIVTSTVAATAENFRRGSRPDTTGRHPVAAEFVEVSRELWDSWTPDGVSRQVAHRGRHFDVSGEFTVPRPPQGHPVLIHAGDSPAGRDFAVRAADVVLAGQGAGHRLPGRQGSRQDTLEAGRAFYAEVKGRLAAHGRSPEELKIMPLVTYVLGDTAAEARERAAAIRREQIPPRNAVGTPERSRGAGFSSGDPDGPLPAVDPGLGPPPAVDPDLGPLPAQGRATATGVLTVAEKRWARAREKAPPVRQTVIEASRHPTFVGTPESVAAELDEFVRTGAADGFVLVPRATPGALEEFVDRVVPLLQERGVFRTAYTDTTLRSHLGLAEPIWKG